MADQTPPAAWIEQRDALLGHLNAASSSDPALAATLAELDPALVEFLLQQVVAQGTREAAAFLEVVATENGISREARTQARAALARLAEGGIAAAPESERFLAGYIQQNREGGEQILLLGWRLPSAEIEALVFLLDWRGDGLRDYYSTHTLSDAQWKELVDHIADKGAPLAEVPLAEARALLDAALAESRRYSRPLPREYKISPGLIDRRILRAELPPVDAPHAFVAPDLTPEQVISAYVAALSYRDYTLAIELLTADHPSRTGRSVAEAASDLRVALKHAPRRDEAVEVAPAGEGERQRVLLATGAEVAVQASGKRVRGEVRERYTLVRQDDAWRIERIERLN